MNEEEENYESGLQPSQTQEHEAEEQFGSVAQSQEEQSFLPDGSATTHEDSTETSQSQFGYVAETDGSDSEAAETMFTPRLAAEDGGKREGHQEEQDYGADYSYYDNHQNEEDPEKRGEPEEEPYGEEEQGKQQYEYVEQEDGAERAAVVVEPMYEQQLNQEEEEHYDEDHEQGNHWSHHYQQVQQYEPEHVEEKGIEPEEGQDEAAARAITASAEVAAIEEGQQDQREEPGEEDYEDDHHEEEDEDVDGLPVAPSLPPEESTPMPSAADEEEEEEGEENNHPDTHSQAYSKESFHSEACSKPPSSARNGMALEDSYPSDFEQSTNLTSIEANANNDGDAADGGPFTEQDSAEQPLHQTRPDATSAAPLSATSAVYVEEEDDEMEGGRGTKHSKQDLAERVKGTKKELEAIKIATAELEAMLEKREIDPEQWEHERVKALKQQVEEVEALVANPTDSTSPLLAKIRARRGNANKREFMLSNLKQVDKELERLKIQESEFELRLTRRRAQKDDNTPMRGSNKEEPSSVDAESFDLSTKAVEKGKANLELSRKLVKLKTDLETCESDVRKARHMLKKAVGKRRGSNTIEDLSLPELLPIYNEVVQEISKDEEEEVAATMAATVGGEGNSAVTALSDKKRLKELERTVKYMQEENETLESQIVEAQQELEKTHSAWKDVSAMKCKVSGLKDQLSIEKDERLKAEKLKRKTEKKLTLLSSHIERSMGYIKHEAVAKARAQDRCRRARKELHLLRRRSSELTRKMHAREELILELKQGARLLEDQLRLMDNRYLELRGKLDYARTSSEAEKKRVQEELEDISKKWDYVKSIFPEGIDPHELRVQMNLLSRCASASAAPSTLTVCDGMLPSISERDGGSPSRPMSHNKKGITVPQYEYPSMADLINAPDPSPLDTPRAHLWSQAKIDLLTDRLKHYQKQPVKPI